MKNKILIILESQKEKKLKKSNMRGYPWKNQNTLEDEKMSHKNAEK